MNIFRPYIAKTVCPRRIHIVPIFICNNIELSDNGALRYLLKYRYIGFVGFVGFADRKLFFL